MDYFDPKLAWHKPDGHPFHNTYRLVRALNTTRMVILHDAEIKEERADRNTMSHSKGDWRGVAEISGVTTTQSTLSYHLDKWLVRYT